MSLWFTEVDKWIKLFLHTIEPRATSPVLVEKGFHTTSSLEPVMTSLCQRRGGGHCTWRGDRIIHWFHNRCQVLSGTVFAFLALSVLVWVHTEGIDGILHGTEALVECQVLTLAQVLRDQGISWICIIETGRTSELVLSGMGCKYGWSKEMLHFQLPYVFLPALLC